MIIKIKFVNIFSRYFIEHKINRKYKIKQGKISWIFWRFYAGKRPNFVGKCPKLHPMTSQKKSKYPGKCPKAHKFNVLGKTMYMKMAKEPYRKICEDLKPNKIILKVI